MYISMKKIRAFVMAAACIMAVAACEKTPVPSPESEQDKQLEAVVQQYVPGVIYKIYGNLADASEALYKQLAEMKASASFTQEQIDRLCSTFLEARKWWEQSEAFLFGAATAYGIDPHIDSWPLDKDKLAKSLSNAETIADLDAEGAAAVDEVGSASLGFHGIEFIIFRNGENRTAAALNGVEDDESFANKTIFFIIFYLFLFYLFTFSYNMPLHAHRCQGLPLPHACLHAGHAPS